MKTHFFDVPVDCKIPFTDEVKRYYDAGVLMLPDSYTDTGKPTRLVLNCHGAGGTVTTNDAAVAVQETVSFVPEAFA